VTPEEEKVRYSKHTNDKADKAYEAYLSAIANDVLDLGVESPRVVDFGSGPHHVLSDILNTRGARCVPHDPLYRLSALPSREPFDIVVACEVFEHLRSLPRELDCISRLLKPDGFVYIRTRLYDPVEDFLSWWYTKDITHINFFCEKTMQVAALMMGKRVVRTNGKDTVVLQ
jgi:SAM-dependent methyltransferase